MGGISLPAREETVESVYTPTSKRKAQVMYTPIKRPEEETAVAEDVAHIRKSATASSGLSMKAWIKESKKKRSPPPDTRRREPTVKGGVNMKEKERSEKAPKSSPAIAALGRKVRSTSLLARTSSKVGSRKGAAGEGGGSTVDFSSPEVLKECMMVVDVEKQRQKQYDPFVHLLHCCVGNDAAVARFLMEGRWLKEKEKEKDITCNPQMLVTVDLLDRYPEIRGMVYPGNYPWIIILG